MLEPDTLPGSFEAIGGASIQLPFQVELPRLSTATSKNGTVPLPQVPFVKPGVSGVGTDARAVASIGELGHLRCRSNPSATDLTLTERLAWPEELTRLDRAHSRLNGVSLPEFLEFVSG